VADAKGLRQLGASARTSRISASRQVAAAMMSRKGGQPGV